MKNVVLSVVAAAAVAGLVLPASAADLEGKKLVTKAPAAAPAPSAFDIAFGTALTTDYVLRGVSQSNHKPAVQGYFELDYTATDWLKLYAGVWGSSLWTGFADAEFDITGGARFTIGNFGLDVGLVYYDYPGGNVSFTGNWLEGYVKPSYKFNDWLTVGGVFETAFSNFNDKVSPLGVWLGDAGHYYVSGNAVITLPWHPAPDVNISINPEVGYEWYSSGVTTNLGFVSDTYWDVGLDINYKAITLDLRYWDIDAKPSLTGNQCGFIPAGTNFCGSRFVATLKFDTTLSALK